MAEHQEESSAEAQSEEPQAEAPKERHAMRDVVNSVADQINRMSKGFLFAGLESLSITAQLTQECVDKASGRIREHSDGDTLTKMTKQMTTLSMEVAEASMDALASSVDKADQIVDKFIEKYREQ